MSIALAAVLSLLAFIGVVRALKRSGDRAIERDIARYRDSRPVYLSCVGRVCRR